MIGIPASAAALSAGQALAAPVPGGRGPHLTPRSQHIVYGHEVIVSGRESPADVGRTVALEFTYWGATGWREVSTTTIGAGGRFRLTGVLERSGVVRAIDASTGSLTAFVVGKNAHAAATSDPVPVDVAAGMHLHARRISVLIGQRIEVRGRLLSALGGRKVSLQALQNGGWQTLATARTGAAGRFVLRYLTGAAGREPLRVRFAGDRLNGRAAVRVGDMTVYRAAGASWYNDGGNTACGFHAYYGVANRTLPCGTTVSFRYNGRSVTATVDDRGPYVAGRDWDLNQNTAAALGFGGVGVVWSSQ